MKQKEMISLTQTELPSIQTVSKKLLNDGVLEEFSISVSAENSQLAYELYLKILSNQKIKKTTPETIDKNHIG